MANKTIPDLSAVTLTRTSEVWGDNGTTDGRESIADILGLALVADISNLAANLGTFLVTPTSANLAAAVTDETGSGALVFANSPTLVTPALGTPSSVTLTNGTGLPVGGISATGTPGSSTYLRGDGSWQTPSGGSADDWDRVDNATNPGATWTLSASTGHAWSYASVNANVQITLGSATVTGTANYLYYRRITVYNSSGGTITITLSGLTKRLGVTPSLSLETLGTFEIVGFTTDLGTTWLYDGDFDISKLTTKSTPVSGDFLLGMDSAASNVMKKFAAPLAGSETVAGLLELATTAEINTATDTGRPMAPDQFAASNFGLRYIMIPLTGLTSDDQATASPAAFGSVPIPAELNGYKVATTKVVQDTAGTTGASTYMPVRVRSGSASDLCTGNISVSSGTLSASGTVQTSGSADVLATDDLLRVNIVGLSTTKPKGGMCVIGVRPA